MRSSWPQIKVDFDPLNRPKGCINSYASVINTAKNGKLIRARLREIVLCFGLVTSFYQNKERAKHLFKNKENRIKQCTFLYAKALLCPRVRPEMSAALVFLPSAMFRVLQCHYKNDGTDFYDVRKFRIYRKRLEFGPRNKKGRKKITLKHTIQYMWTPLLACMFALYGGQMLNSGINKLDLRKLNCVKYAWNRKETALELQKYLDVVLGIHGLYVTKKGFLIFKTEKSKDAFWDIVNQEAEKLLKELKEGGYLGERKNNA